MAETFRSQLLRAENVVQPNSSERCYICLTEWGTLCNDTGTVEMEIQLPCKHTVGSRCIATWLDPTSAASNSCPVCRYQFFPAQPRPYLEHGIIDEEHVDVIDDGEYDEYGRPMLENPYPSPSRIIDEEHVDVTDDGEYDEYGRPMLENPYPSPSRMETNETPYLSPRRMETNENPYLSPRRMEINENPYLLPRRVRTNENPYLLPSGMGTDNEEDEEERDHADRTNNGEHDNSAESDPWARSPVHNALSEFNLPLKDLELVGNFCQHYCFWLEFPSSLRVHRLAQCLARAIYVADLFEGHNLSAIAAVSVFVASYLEEVPKTLGWMSTMSRVDSDVIANLYGVFRLTAESSGVVSRRLLRIIGRGDWDTVVESLPDIGSLLA